MAALLLDEMFSAVIADQLRAKGHDVLAVVADPALSGLADEQILTHATATGRALISVNIKDFMPLDARCRAASQTHCGLVLVSVKAFPQDRTYTGAIVSALSALLNQTDQIPARPDPLPLPTVVASGHVGRPRGRVVGEAASTSAGKTLGPPVMIMSTRRSTR
jgi:hypothetical protein